MISGSRRVDDVARAERRLGVVAGALHGHEAGGVAGLLMSAPGPAAAGARLQPAARGAKAVGVEPIPVPAHDLGGIAGREALGQQAVADLGKSRLSWNHGGCGGKTAAPSRCSARPWSSGRCASRRRSLSGWSWQRSEPMPMWSTPIRSAAAPPCGMKPRACSLRTRPEVVGIERQAEHAAARRRAPSAAARDLLRGHLPGRDWHG